MSDSQITEMTWAIEKRGHETDPIPRHSQSENLTRPNWHTSVTTTRRCMEMRGYTNMEGSEHSILCHKTACEPYGELYDSMSCAFYLSFSEVFWDTEVDG